MIVNEEREQKNKSQLPTYAGLENYKLVVKMGEYVISPISSSLHFTHIYQLQWCILERIPC